MTFEAGEKSFKCHYKMFTLDECHSYLVLQCIGDATKNVSLCESFAHTIKAFEHIKDKYRPSSYGLVVDTALNNI